MDILADIVTATRLAETRLSHATLVRPWGLFIDPLAEVAVHSVQRGNAWLRLAATERPVELLEGDVVLIRAGVAHAISDSLDTPIEPHADALAAMPARFAALGAEARSMVNVALCAKYAFAQRSPHPLIARLPRLIHVSARAPRHAQLARVLELLTQEALEPGVASELVVRPLVDSLLALVLRAFLEDQPEAAGWLATLRDPAVHRALELIHGSPTTPWTVATLAREVAQSRASFARHFTQLVGESPVAYLTRWRLALGARLLRETQLSLDEVSQQVGYESGAAFAKAFKRERGETPGRYRSATRGAST